MIIQLLFSHSNSPFMNRYSNILAICWSLNCNSLIVRHSKTKVTHSKHLDNNTCVYVCVCVCVCVCVAVVSLTTPFTTCKFHYVSIFSWLSLCRSCTSGEPKEVAHRAGWREGYMLCWLVDWLVGVGYYANLRWFLQPPIQVIVTEHRGVYHTMLH